MLDDILDKTPLLWLNPPISAINLWTPRHSGCVIRSRFLVLGYLLLGKTCSVKSWEFPNGPNLPTPVGPPFVRPLPWGVAWGSGTPLDSHDQRWRFSTFTGLILAAHWWSTERTYSFWLFFAQTGFGTMEKKPRRMKPWRTSRNVEVFCWSFSGRNSFGGMFQTSCQFRWPTSEKEVGYPGQRVQTNGRTWGLPTSFKKNK